MASHDEEYFATAAIVVPLDDSSLSLARGEVVAASKIPAGSLEPMLRLGQLAPVAEMDEDTPEQPQETEDVGVDQLQLLNLSRTVVAKLTAAGLDTREKVVAHAKAHDGFGDLLGPQQAEAVFAALKATAD